MRGHFNPKYINSTSEILEKRCLTLLVEAYHTTQSNGNISIDWEEEDISKELVLTLYRNTKRLEWQIDVTPEYRIYKDDGIAAKRAARIDFRFSGWAVAQWDYYAEAKNLIETGSFKDGRETKISASRLHKRYIETGIDAYASGKYPPNGCLIGYVLQGRIETIVSCLNNCLHNANRTSEILKQYCFGLADINSSYVSIHENSHLLKHLMLDYSRN